MMSIQGGGASLLPPSSSCKVAIDSSVDSVAAKARAPVTACCWTSLSSASPPPSCPLPRLRLLLLHASSLPRHRMIRSALQRRNVFEESDENGRKLELGEATGEEIFIFF
nr:hypothetical protein Itr_chr12CG26650 [Ipomoea trifida]